MKLFYLTRNDTRLFMICIDLNAIKCRVNTRYTITRIIFKDSSQLAQSNRGSIRTFLHLLGAWGLEFAGLVLLILRRKVASECRTPPRGQVGSEASTRPCRWAAFFEVILVNSPTLWPLVTGGCG